MKKRKKYTTPSLRDFEEKAGELVSLALALTEARFAILKKPSPVSKAQASAALAIKHAIETFMAIAKLEE